MGSGKAGDVLRKSSHVLSRGYVLLDKYLFLWHPRLKRPRIKKPLRWHKKEVRDVLKTVYKNLSANDDRTRAKLRQVLNAKTSFVSYDFHVGNYGLMPLSDSQNKKLGAGWVGAVCLGGNWSELAFDMKGLHGPETTTVHAQQLVPYSLKPSK